MITKKDIEESAKELKHSSQKVGHGSMKIYRFTSGDKKEETKDGSKQANSKKKLPVEYYQNMSPY